MKIAVLGAGAMGSIYGGFLSPLHDVWLIDLNQDHVDTINHNGLIVEEASQTYRFTPHAVNCAKSVGPADLVIVFVKSIDTAVALAGNPELFTSQTIVLSLQNGWGNADDILYYVSPENLILGTTSHGGTLLRPGYVRHSGRAKTYIGVLNGSNSRVNAIRATLSEAGFITEATDQIREKIWTKLLINCAINPLTALLNVTNGALINCPATQTLMEQIVSEAVQVANAAGMDFEPTSILEAVKRIAQITRENRSSMLQDVTYRRKTEIDRINGAIVLQGKAAGIATPINTLILELIHALEHSYLFN